MSWTVYCHTHIESGRRYVGLTSQTMEKRWKNHVHLAKSSKNGRWHFPNAIRKYGKDAFSHEILGTFNSLEEANAEEERLIEEWGLRNPDRGFNLAKGGEHKPHPIKKNPWDNPEYRNKATLAAKTRWDDPQYRVKAITANKLAWKNLDRRAKASAISKEVHSRPEVKAKISQKLTGRVLSAEHKAKIPSFKKGIALSPEIREKIRMSLNSPEVKVKLVSASTGRTPSLKTRAKISAKSTGRKHTAEAKAKNSAAHKGKVFGPEARANMSAAQKGHATSQETKEKIRQSNLGKRNSPEAIERAARKARKYVMDEEGNIAYKMCLIHGLVPVGNCFVSQKKNGHPLVLCKECKNVQTRKRRRRLARVLGPKRTRSVVDKTL